jgi:hypothetical protein
VFLNRAWPLRLLRGPAKRADLTLRFQDFQRATRGVVIEYADRQVSRIPSKGIEVGSIFH